MKPTFLAALLCVLLVTKAEAQSYRYIDGSGNIHFVDRVSDIPKEYRQQIYPTPTPLNPKDWKKQQKFIAKQQKQKQKEALKQQKREQKEQAKLAKQEAKKKSAANGKKTGPGSLRRPTPTPETMSPDAEEPTPAASGGPTPPPTADTAR